MDWVLLPSPVPLPPRHPHQCTARPCAFLGLFLSILLSPERVLGMKTKFSDLTGGMGEGLNHWEKREKRKDGVGKGGSGMISLAAYLLLPFPRKINVGLCAVSHSVSVCVCVCVCLCLLHRVVLICLRHSSASLLLPLLLLLWLASGIIERDIYQNRSCVCRRWPEKSRLRPPIPTRLWPSAVSKHTAGTLAPQVLGNTRWREEGARCVPMEFWCCASRHLLCKGGGLWVTLLCRLGWHRARRDVRWLSWALAQPLMASTASQRH